MIKALIIDDEPAAAQVLQLMIERHVPAVTSMRVAHRQEEANALIRQFKPDLVFQDIVMPEKNGFEFLSALPEINFEIIFTTAYNEYAIRAIKFSALDYLLKPINAAELKAAVDRFAEKRERALQSDALLKNLVSNLGQKNESQFKLAVPSYNGIVFLDVNDIIRLEGEGNYTQFILANGKKYLSAKTLKEYEEILLQHHFLRIHKSHLVNIKYIVSYSHDSSILLQNNFKLPVSRQRRQQVLAALK